MVTAVTALFTIPGDPCKDGATYRYVCGAFRRALGTDTITGCTSPEVFDYEDESSISAHFELNALTSLETEDVIARLHLATGYDVSERKSACGTMKIVAVAPECRL